MRDRDRRPVFPRWLVAVLAIAATGWVLYELRGVLTPVFFAFLIAYLLDPVVDRLETWRIPRAAGITLLLTALLGAFVLFALLVVPGIVRDVVDFAEELPGEAERLLAAIEPTLNEWGIAVPHTLDEALAQLSIDAREVAGGAVGPAAAVLGWVVGGTASALGAIAGVLMIPIFAFYLLYDFDRMTVAIRDLVPWRIRPHVVEVAREADEVLSQFIRGQLLVMLLLAILYSVGYGLVGVRLAVVIGIVAGLLSFIPYVGGAVALGLAVLMCLFDWGGWTQLLAVVGVYTVIQVLEGFVITPKIVGDKVGLPAVWVLFALMVGGEVFGFMGVLLALPAAAVGKIFVIRALGWYRESSWYRAGAPAGASVPVHPMAARPIEGIVGSEDRTPHRVAPPKDADEAPDAAREAAQEPPAAETAVVETPAAEPPAVERGVEPGPDAEDNAPRSEGEAAPDSHDADHPTREEHER